MEGRKKEKQKVDRFFHPSKMHFVNLNYTNKIEFDKKSHLKLLKN